MIWVRAFMFLTKRHLKKVFSFPREGVFLINCLFQITLHSHTVPDWWHVIILVIITIGDFADGKHHLISGNGKWGVGNFNNSEPPEQSCLL
jgi:hypothetical protein